MSMVELPKLWIKFPYFFLLHLEAGPGPLHSLHIVSYLLTLWMEIVTRCYAKRFGTSWVMSLPLQVTCMGGCTAGKRITKRKPRIGFSSSLALEREQLQNAPNIARHVAAKSHLSFPRKDFIFYMSFFITYIIIYIYLHLVYICNEK